MPTKCHTSTLAPRSHGPAPPLQTDSRFGVQVHVSRRKLSGGSGAPSAATDASSSSSSSVPRSRSTSRPAASKRCATGCSRHAPSSPTVCCAAAAEYVRAKALRRLCGWWTCPHRDTLLVLLLLLLLLLLRRALSDQLTPHGARRNTACRIRTTPRGVPQLATGHGGCHHQRGQRAPVGRLGPPRGKVVVTLPPPAPDPDR
jgi:hypothetical protein|eukprot:COSAG01_NODE_2079_length_8464_cov_7.812821_9_plen_201_part_00